MQVQVRRLHASTCLLFALATGDAVATTLADCDNAAPSTTLLAQPDHADARALWLDARTLRWPGKSADARLRLIATDGATTTPFDLTPMAAVLPDALQHRFAWFGAGAHWQVPADRGEDIVARLGDNLLLVEEDAAGRVLDATRVQHAAALDARYAAATALDYGVLTGDDGTALRLWAPTARAVAACLYPDAAAPASALVPLQRDATTGAWSATIAAGSGGYYTYLVDVFAPGTGWVRNRVTDPYSASLGADSRRSWLGTAADPRTKPEGWDDAPPSRPLRRNTDAVIYELHVRDFSIADATVPAAHRGRYLAFTDRDSAGMGHLQALAAAGVTDVHLLPVYDFGSVPEVGCTTPTLDPAGDELAAQAAMAPARETDCFNWGYDPLHFGAPEGSYATDPGDGPGRIREFRAMVMALHAAGLRVGMDVVYNHTFASGQNPRAVLDRIVPGYYHRLDDQGVVARSTCCDNTATENPMMAKLMIDTAVVWARDYAIDSFRFDLMGHQPRAAMERLQQAVDAAAGRHVQLIGEGWNFGEIADGARFVQASQRSLGGSGIATFSDRMRDAVRGGGCCDDAAALAGAQGWANGLYYAANAVAPAGADAAALARAADLVRLGSAGTLAEFAFTGHDGVRRTGAGIDYAGQPAGYAQSPAEVVNYVENHDNMTLYDIHAMKLPVGTPASERARVQLLSLATVALAQGVAYFHAGGEILRSKSLDRNSFNSGDAFNGIDWSLQHNGFGVGLPPAEDNRASWDVMRPVLADPSVPPSPTDIRWTRDAFLDLVRIRRDTPLLHLDDADAVRRRLHPVPVGPDADGTVVGAWLDGAGLTGSTRTLAWFINAGTQAADVDVPELAGQALSLHPLQAAADAADARPRTDARYDAAIGRFRIPPRTVVVWVAD